VNKTAASAVQSAKCILLYTYLCIQLLAPSCTRTNKYLTADLTAGITVYFGYKLRTIEAENP